MIEDSGSMETFLEEYGKYMRDVLEPTRKELQAIFGSWKDPTYWERPTEKGLVLPRPSPVHSVFSRVKRPESVLDKIARRGVASFPDGTAPQSFRLMNDAVAARVIVYFLRNLALVDGELRKMEGQGVIEISSDPAPVAYMSEDLAVRFGLAELLRRRKESGYVSVDYILRLRGMKSSLIERPWFELQVRTLTEHTWGEIEHILGYKPRKRTSLAVQKQFQIISALLVAIDEHFNFLYEELSRFQEDSRTEDIEDSHPLNAENLPHVLSELGVSCSQKEIDVLLKLLVSRGVKAVGPLRKLKNTRRLDIIRSTYLNLEGRPPINFEVVANLANLVGCEREEEQVERIKAQIASLNLWLTYLDEQKEGRDKSPK